MSDYFSEDDLPRDEETRGVVTSKEYLVEHLNCGGAIEDFEESIREYFSVMIFIKAPKDLRVNTSLASFSRKTDIWN